MPGGVSSKRVLYVEVENKPGVLTRISSLFSRRGYNVESLTVGHTHEPGISRFTIVVDCDDLILEQIKKHCQKIIQVIKAEELKPEASIQREFSILKLRYDERTGERVNRVVDFYGARLLDSAEGTLTVEISGSEEKVDCVIEELKDVEIIESIRTGKVGMARGGAKTKNLSRHGSK